MEQKHAELMRSLVAAQAALWDVVDAPNDTGPKIMLAVIVARVTRLSNEITGTTVHRTEN